MVDNATTQPFISMASNAINSNIMNQQTLEMVQQLEEIMQDQTTLVNQVQEEVEGFQKGTILEVEGQGITNHQYTDQYKSLKRAKRRKLAQTSLELLLSGANFIRGRRHCPRSNEHVEDGSWIEGYHTSLRRGS